MKLDELIRLIFLFSLCNLLISFVFGIPDYEYLFSPQQEKRLFLANSQVTIVPANTKGGERTIKLTFPNNAEYSLPCDGLRHLCSFENSGSTITVDNLDILYFDKPKYRITEDVGVILAYQYKNTLYKNTEFQIGKDSLLGKSFVSSLLGLKTSIFLLVIVAVLRFLKRFFKLKR